MIKYLERHEYRQNGGNKYYIDCNKVEKNTDSELLELVAKAAGLNVKAHSVNADDHWIGLIIGEKHTREKKFWNPLSDDGDALRLAVKLGLQIEINTRLLGDTLVISEFYDNVQCHNGDPYAATRRAIACAAAEIGKNMGEQA